MTERLPYLVLKDFRVWFAKRRGFFEALRRSEPGYVRAVDGIDVTIGKGEIYCLVGESGCGKTTTGKGILQLVMPTGGDVFLNPTKRELHAYENAKANRDAAALKRARMRSLTYREDIERRLPDYLINVLLLVAGAVVGVFATLGVILGLRAVDAGDAESLAYLVLGALVAFFGTGSIAKVGRGMPYVFVITAVVSCIPTQAAAIAFARFAGAGSIDLGSVLAAYSFYLQENSLFVALTQMILAAIAAWTLSSIFSRFWGGSLGVETDRLRRLRTRLQMIFQDPYESLNPRHTVYDIVAEPLLVNRITQSRAETEARVEQALADAGLRPPKEYLLRFPHEMSGGQRQRVGIAGALVLEPEFLVADEPVSMLDVSIRTEILELLLNLRERRNLTYLFITHDLSLAYVLADRIGVMYLGKIVEEGPTEELVANPLHPYTKALISVVPLPDPDRKHERTILRGERPDPSDVPSGCRFHPRCPVAFERCGWTSDEVLAALREATKGDAAKFLAAARPAGPQSIVWSQAPLELDTWLKGLIAEKSETTRGLKANETIERTGNGLKVQLHAFEEPALRRASPSVSVACHLYT